MPETPVEIFCSYALSDERWQQRLERYLSSLLHQGLIAPWHKRRISPGVDQTKTIDNYLNTASIFLLLISSDFLVSDYCYSSELKRMLERHEAGEARVIPILLRPVDWQGTPFAHIQALPTDARPITSWAIRDEAFLDVVAGIRRVIEDMPLLAASSLRAVLPPVWNIPYPRNPFFLGRESELAQIRQRLQTSQITSLSQPQAISGLGGIGKTQLALEYAYRYARNYQAILWANADSINALATSYVTIAGLLRLPEYDAKEQEEIVHAVKIWLQTHHGWLLILDNADELILILDFLPSSFRGHLLLTTRAAATGRLAHRLEVETFLPNQGALFLLRRAALIAPDATLEHVSPQERKLAMQISQELGGLPLALDQAGAYIEETGTSLANYWHLYQSYRLTLLQERGGLVVDYPSSVATTWSLSFERVEKRNPAAAELLCLCAYLAPDAIPEEILTVGESFLGSVLASAAADPFLLNQAIEALRAYSLVRRNLEEKSLSVHRLVQAVLQENMSTESRRLWAERAVLCVHKTFPSYIEPATWSQCERLLAHAQICADLINQWDLSLPEAAHLLNKTGRYLYARALYAEAEAFFRQALAIYEQQVGPNLPDAATTLNNLAQLYRAQGKYAEAEAFFRQALAIYEQQVGPDHPSTVTCLNNLALLYRAQGRYAEAEPLLQRTLAFREQQMGSDHPDTATSLSNLAGFYQDQSNYERAEPLYQRALMIDEKIFGPIHPAVATDLNNLAELYRAQGKYEQAESLFQRALAISEQGFGPDHPDVATGLNNLALLYQIQGKYEQAKLLLQRALIIYERLLGQAHPHTLAVQRNYTSLLEAMNK